MTPSTDQFERLASFYLGRRFDLERGSVSDDLLMYDAKDLTTHAMCVGMTGSGKTGLCVSMLEEAAIDGIPVICVDPKGDLSNLALSFPGLKPSDFKPYVEPAEATRKGMNVDDYAADRADLWRDGLQSWGQSPERIQRFRDAADVRIYTPGSNTGLPLTVLQSLDAPPAEILEDTELFGQRVTGAATGLLTMIGIDGDPLLSPEHILVSSILNHCWQQNRNVAIAQLIGLIQSPPIKRIGVIDLETFMPASDRGKLAMRLNNLLASPAFAGWTQGEPLSIPNLLRSPDGKPRISVLSIAHLSDRERMFFVTILLNEMLAWMRTQSGTGSLRAMFYMDEVAGYFPPVANPPSKPPMLTLLKQARAFGLGITLATQNPVDIDYKGLSNIGTWFLGRLQTERDKARVMEGLEGAAVQSGATFDYNEMDQILAGLGNRVFLMNNVHDDGPVVFQTRWALSYLAGPLGRDKIAALMDPFRDSVGDSDVNASDIDASNTDTSSADLASAGDARSAASDEPPVRPVVPAGIVEQFLVPTRVVGGAQRLIYRPGILCRGTLHYVKSGAGLDLWRDAASLMRCHGGLPSDDWESSINIDCRHELVDKPEEGFRFAPLPDDLAGKRAYQTLDNRYKDYLYRHRTMTVYRSALLKEYAPPGSDLAAARGHFELIAREHRDEETEKIRERYRSKMEAIDKKIRAAEDRVEREEAEYNAAKTSTLISLGSSLLGAFLGSKMASRTNVNRMGTAARASTRAARQKGDVGRAEDRLRELAGDQLELNERLAEDLDELSEKFAIDNLDLETSEVSPRKGDLNVTDAILVWEPWAITAEGIAKPLI